jgi:hypothetical protein
MHAGDLLMYEALQLALKRGMRWFDFGSDSPMQETLLFFKRKWGAAQGQVPFYWWGSGYQLLDTSERRYSLARTVLRYTPQAIHASVVSRLTRYFG